MHRVLFICHGNICRSTMAESVMTELVRRANLEKEFEIDSAATSYEEIGNPRITGPSPSCTRWASPWYRTARASSRAQNTTAGTTSYIWTQRTAEASSAFCTATPQASSAAYSTGPTIPAM